MALDYTVRLGYAPTRREIFSREDAQRQRSAILEKIKGYDVEILDIDWLNDEGLLYDSADAEAVARYFTVNGADAVFAPHCNFGTEDAVARMAKLVDRPLLLWGPRDDKPLPDGLRTRDSQCGLFATSKVLQRFGVPFTYIENCALDSPVFAREFDQFLSVCSIVKNFRGMRIGQIGTRPEGFWSVICDEGELLGRLGIQTIPISLPEIVQAMEELLAAGDKRVDGAVDQFRSRYEISCGEKAIRSMAALKFAISDWAESRKLSAVAIQCWNALQAMTGVMPCVINGELTEEGLPMACETDIHGAITSVILSSAVRGRTPIFFSDLTVRHPENDNAELLWHCGPFPYSLKEPGAPARIGDHYLLGSHSPGVGEWPIRGGDITVCRFDGIGGSYRLLSEEGVSVDGPVNRGTYVWVEFPDWPALERKFIEGPYIHHVACAHGKLSAVLDAATTYLQGITPDHC